MACLKDLDNVFHKHRDELVKVKVKDWRNGFEEKPLGELSSYDFSTLDLRKPIKPQRKWFPLAEVWEEWERNRSAKLKDKNGFELLGAMVAVELFYDSYDSLRLRNAQEKKIAKSLIGEFAGPKLRCASQVGEILNWLFHSKIPKGMVDFLTDATENAYAQVTDDQHLALLELEERPNQWYVDEDENDWRQMKLYAIWEKCLSRFLNRAQPKLTKAQKKRYWDLRRFEDEPLPGARRSPLELGYLAECYRVKLATFDDVVDVILGPGANTYNFAKLTSPTLDKETQKLVESTKGLGE